MKAVVAAFNQEKALVGAFSVITNLRMELFEALVATDRVHVPPVVLQEPGVHAHGEAVPLRQLLLGPAPHPGPRPRPALVRGGPQQPGLLKSIEYVSTCM